MIGFAEWRQGLAFGITKGEVLSPAPLVRTSIIISAVECRLTVGGEAIGAETEFVVLLLACGAEIS